ncbi:SIS domain-containing protein [Candidatus Marinimicrobia bacterium]|nr:SIS domain-containing protein [Candidatus Neomarinimicrobiota bacterium]
MNKIKRMLKEHMTVSSQIFDSCGENLMEAIELSISALNNGKKIIWCGNGGSAADAQHMAAELMGGLTSHDRKPIESIALTTDTSFITAWSNDDSFSNIFSRQVEGLGKEGDVLFAISTSGNSINIINALTIANKKKIKTIVLTGGKKSLMNEMSDVIICIPSTNTQRIQEGHLLVEHIICEHIESNFLS